MSWLKRLGFTGLSMHNLQPYLSGSKSGKVVGITFDDGFQNVHRNALPVLDALGFSATNYFVSNQIGKSNQWDREIGIPYAACMSRAEMAEWVAAGNEVGAHTLDHPCLTDLSLDTARHQISASRKALQDQTGEPVTTFAYPYGCFSESLRDLVKEAGFTNATTTVRRRARPDNDPFLLPRKIVRDSDGFGKFMLKCLVR